MSEQILTVSQVNRYIKKLLDSRNELKNITIQGELSNFKLHTSGHAYFSLKDTSSILRCVCFSSNMKNIRFRMENGKKILVSGYIGVYDRDGSYQFYVRTIEPDGVGSLALAYEQLKQKLQAEGYFDDAHKIPIPRYAKKIGVVTSRTGAVIRDIINVTKHRNPTVQIILRQSLVQGENAAKDLIEGIKFFNQHYPVDVIIIGRGGGSQEDLWSFNDENLVKAVYNSKIPVISAVGHESDFTLIDCVADKRASTPSQAAEFAVPALDDMLYEVQNLSKQLYFHVDSRLQLYKGMLRNISRDFEPQYRERILQNYIQDLDSLYERLGIKLNNGIQEKVHQLALMQEKLFAYNPEKILERGLGFLKKGSSPVKSIKDVSIGDNLDICIKDGIITTSVAKITPIK